MNSIYLDSYNLLPLPDKIIFMIKYYQNSSLVFKTRWITDNGLYFSEKELEESVLMRFEGNPKEFEKDIIFIPYAQIESLTPISENQQFLLDIDVKEPEKYQAVVADFISNEQMDEAVLQITRQSGLKEHIEITKDKSWVRNLLYTFVAGFFGYSLVMMSKEIEAGKVLDLSGRRSGVKKILATVAEQLGVVGSIVLAIVIVAVCGYLTFKAFKTSHTKISVWK
ncbi:hypothetical protein ORI89_02885 [Sphingobacterium sp. UT-1RO-CII-1]|uniref:hypothetical protein n=1 Tax=Sphingobacterium sp. UT-1RO-CII-1 TaxID=2995225 RepID=UPI00227C59A8|nr:hypothetical protein [Sphingobacterium sp. UT-1RO-CII-1]MCY4778581.1 hypothetical protein [Sphingobacterium sp. UT-1RO-CII-1]